MRTLLGRRPRLRSVMQGEAAGAPCKHDHAHQGGRLDHKPPADALLSARGVFLTRAGRAILEGVDIDIGAGEIVTLIGPNGAGKTTLVRALLGLEPVDRGNIRR